jgi:formylglycine-generating enzyme
MSNRKAVCRCLSSLIVVLAVVPPAVVRAQEGQRTGELNPNTSYRMLWCGIGSFQMGSPANEAGRDDNEAQVQASFSRGYWLGDQSVTQRQWKQVMNTEPWKGKPGVMEGTEYFPATFVSYDDAEAFCQKLTQTETNAHTLPDGWKYELPTEAQREYACRASSTTAYCFGDDPAKLSDYGWWSSGKEGNAVNELWAHQVGIRQNNKWGFFDMHGNVWEWCRDCYADKLPGGVDPLVTQGDKRVLRGGCFNSSASNCRSAERIGLPSNSRNQRYGFRVVLIRAS